jgi:hypothetical protein
MFAQGCIFARSTTTFRFSENAMRKHGTVGRRRPEHQYPSMAGPIHVHELVLIPTSAGITRAPIARTAVLRNRFTLKP